MKCQLLFPACLVLLWTLTGAQEEAKAPAAKIKVVSVSDGIKLSCVIGQIKNLNTSVQELRLDYKDEKTGEYTCDDDTKIFVKFRTCDNCIELDTGSIVGLIVGELVATIGIGVGVYLVASQNRTGPKISNKKGSDRQPLFPSEMSRGNSDHYQPLKPRGGQKDMYDVLNNRR